MPKACLVFLILNSFVGLYLATSLPPIYFSFSKMFVSTEQTILFIQALLPVLTTPYGMFFTCLCMLLWWQLPFDIWIGSLHSQSLVMKYYCGHAELSKVQGWLALRAGWFTCSVRGLYPAAGVCPQLVVFDLPQVSGSGCVWDIWLHMMISAISSQWKKKKAPFLISTKNRCIFSVCGWVFVCLAKGF